MAEAQFEAAGRAVARSLQHHWKLFLIEGIVLVLLGIGALLVPLIAGLAITILLGWIFLFSGFVGLATTIAMRHGAGFWWSLASAVLSILLGGALLILPGAGLVSLTYLLMRSSSPKASHQSGIRATASMRLPSGSRTKAAKTEARLY
jgi:uncharacterized membrane protein HdeD (DUF308 family)